MLIMHLDHLLENMSFQIILYDTKSLSCAAFKILICWYNFYLHNFGDNSVF